MLEGTESRPALILRLLSGKGWTSKPSATELLQFPSNLSLYPPGTVFARCLIFPLIVKGQREAAKIHNHVPEIQRFTARIREAKLAGDHVECESVAEGPMCTSDLVLGEVRSSIIGRVLKVYLLPVPGASRDWPGSVMGLVMGMYLSLV